MRIFAITTLATIMLGLGTALAVAEPLVGRAPGAPIVTAPDPATSQYVALDRALQRLELEAQVEDFYAELRAEAEGLDAAGREALYRDATRRLQRLILGSQSFAGDNFEKGVDYLRDAQLVLARELGVLRPAG